jgi:hypothetical protein
MPSVQRILQLAPVACYLASNRTAKGNLFGPPVDPRLPIAIFMVHKILKKIYDLDPTYESLNQRNVADYLYELIQKYAFRAAAIVDNNAGGQIATQTSVIVQSPYDFEVTGTSFIATGETSVTISEFIGLNVNFRRGGVSQNTTNLGDGSSYYSWNIVTGVFTIYPAATAGELFRIEPDNVGGASTITVIDDVVFPFLVVSADFEADGITLIDAKLAGNTVTLYPNNFAGNWLIQDTDFTISGSTLTITNPSFNANNFNYTIKIDKVN